MAPPAPEAPPTSNSGVAPSPNNSSVGETPSIDETRAEEPADPSLLLRLSAVASQPKRFRGLPQQGFAEARRLFQATEVALRARRWREEKRTRCADEHGGAI